MQTKNLWITASSISLLTALAILPFSHAAANGLFSLSLISSLVNYEIFLSGIKTFWNKHNLLFIGISLYMFLTIIGTFWSEDTSSSFEFITKLTYWLLIPVIIGLTNNNPKLYNQILITISTGLFLHLIITSLQALSIINLSTVDIGGTYSHDPSGLFGHMSFGFIYAIWAGAMISKAITTPLKYKVPLYIISLYALISIFQTHGRSGYIITCAILFLVLSKYLLVAHKKNLLIGLTISIIIIVSFFVTNDDTNQRIQQTIKGTEHFLAGNFSQASERLKIWAVSSEIIRENKYLGIGTGDFKQHFTNKASSPTFTVYNIRTAYNHAHNEYIFSWVRWGPTGFLVVIFLIFIWIYSGVKMNWEQNRLNAYLVTASGIAVFINAFSDSIFSAYSTLIYAIIALAIGSSGVQQNKKNLNT